MGLSDPSLINHNFILSPSQGETIIRTNYNFGSCLLLFRVSFRPLRIEGAKGRIKNVALLRENFIFLHAMKARS